MEGKKILIAEDDPLLGMMVKDCLESENFSVELVEDGEAGFDAFLDFFPDLCVFDVMMPKKDGFTLAKEVRAYDKGVPIIFLTAKSMKDDVLSGFEAGADDYVKKPFSMEVLLIRIQSILTRIKDNGKVRKRRVYRIGQYVFDHFFQRLSFDGKEIKLSTKESDLLKLLCENKNELLPRELALNTLWGEADYFNGRTMDVYINKLRKHLMKDGNVEIVNQRGKGHILQC